MKKKLILGFIAFILIVGLWSIVRWFLIIGGAIFAIAAPIIYFSKSNQAALEKARMEGDSLPEVKEVPLYKPKNFKQETVASLKNPDGYRLMILPEETYYLKGDERVSLPETVGLMPEAAAVLPGEPQTPAVRVQAPAVWTQEELEKLDLSDLIPAVQSAFQDEKVDPSLKAIGVTRAALVEEGADIPNILDEHLRKLLLQYADLQQQVTRTDREEGMIATISDGLGTVQEALENLYDRLVNRKAIEIESEIEAMEMKLRADGLLGSEFDSQAGAESI